MPEWRIRHADHPERQLYEHRPQCGRAQGISHRHTISQTYNRLKGRYLESLGKLPVGGHSAANMASKIEHSIKGFISRSSNLFEA